MNWGMIGHEWAVEYLQRSIASGHTAHAYLITGPAGIGKALLALRMAQVFNCEQSGDAPCLQCRACRRIASGNHPDVRLASMQTQAAGVKASDAARQKDLKIDTVRAWQRDIALKPYEGRHRVFILHDAERLNEEASNAMLKTLEEPPPFAMLILVANNTNLLATIVSRCQVIRLRPLPREHVAQALITHAGVEPERAALLAAWSNGRIGWALHAASSPDEILARQEQLETLLALHSQPHSISFRWAEDRSKEYRGGEQTTVLDWLDLWQSWWRDLLLTAAGCPESITHIDRREDLEREARRYKLQEIYRFVVRLDEAARQLRENVNPQLALENLLLHLPGRAG
jgi:DNA polymerase-3 subunit delta'